MYVTAKFRVLLGREDMLIGEAALPDFDPAKQLFVYLMGEATFISCMTRSKESSLAGVRRK